MLNTQSDTTTQDNLLDSHISNYNFAQVPSKKKSILHLLVSMARSSRSWTEDKGNYEQSSESFLLHQMFSE